MSNSYGDLSKTEGDALFGGLEDYSGGGFAYDWQNGRKGSALLEGITVVFLLICLVLVYINGNVNIIFGIFTLAFTGVYLFSELMPDLYQNTPLAKIFSN